MSNITLRGIAASIKKSFSTNQQIKVPAMSGKDFRQLMTELSK